MSVLQDVTFAPDTEVNRVVHQAIDTKTQTKPMWHVWQFSYYFPSGNSVKQTLCKKQQQQIQT